MVTVFVRFIWLCEMSAFRSSDIKSWIILNVYNAVHTFVTQCVVCHIIIAKC